jgi:hypothetical protein
MQGRWGGKSRLHFVLQCLLRFFALKLPQPFLNIVLCHMVSIYPRGKMKLIFKKLDKCTRARKTNQVNNFI